MHLRSLLKSVTAGAALIVFSVATPARALEGVEGSTLGDQGYYWYFPQESWIFAHRVSNSDNRGMFQLRGSAAPIVLTAPSILSNSASSLTLWNATPVTVASGGGVIVNGLIAENLTLGVWFAEYQPGMAGFVGRALSQTGWAHAGDCTNEVNTPGTTNNCQGGADNTVNDLNNVEAYDAAIDAGRKLDFFLSYAMPDSGIEAGLHLWYGSGWQSIEPDDTGGPIHIDPDSNSTDANSLATSEDSPVAESRYGISDFGIGLGAGYTGMDAMRIDAGLEFNLLSVDYAPNSEEDMLDAGGTGFAVNLRAHYDMDKDFKIGAFLRYAREGYSFKPLRQRDGGDLAEFWDTAAPENLPDPGTGANPSGDPATNIDDLSPVEGIMYEETRSDMQVAVISRWTPVSRVILYGSAGFGRVAASSRLSVNEDWYEDTTARYQALPFIHLGLAGRLTNQLDMFMGVSKRWQNWSSTSEAFDGRIPEDGNLNAGAPPNGREDYTNENRQTITVTNSEDASITRLAVGARYHLGGFQLTAQMNPQMFFTGPFFLFGQPTPGGTPIFWFSVGYDWDYDTDKDSGNGTIIRDAKAAKSGDEVYDS